MTGFARLAGLVTALASGLLVFPAAFVALLAAFLFDAPGSERSIPTIVFAAALLTSPFACALSCAIAVSDLKAGSRRRLVLAWILLVAPIVVGGAAYLAIETFCSGSLVCS